ncbi:putative quinol monooxygenase [Chromohalobacter japonicus]|uniref:Antibiotic biosynthesis monooxygenase n=1 Tax=Chromohalobacter japonicus TaxID=223900 RepID=A0A1Q8T9R3_9GAMM|nr:putative quinol monooxygenase [Chromohalobacter japonicus]MCK0753985.1 antibiotic biosynthesis monooxygenase [Chromohalobacter japonicus]OLO10415.1 antibiotic biosynthesis monooxygenase [Chromohalobacter japonicus]
MSSTQSHFVVLAEFRIKEGQIPAFLALAHNDANESLANEEGCLAFDVLTPEGSDNLVVLHEVYRDRDAFEHHMQMPHYAPFKEGSAPLLEGEPNVRFFYTAIRPE